MAVEAPADLDRVRGAAGSRETGGPRADPGQNKSSRRLQRARARVNGILMLERGGQVWNVDKDELMFQIIQDLFVA